MGGTPVAVDTDELEYVGDAGTELHTGFVPQRRRAVGEEHRGLHIGKRYLGDIAVIGIGKAPPSRLEREFLTQPEPADERQLAQEEAVEAMIVEDGDPRIIYVTLL